MTSVPNQVAQDEAQRPEPSWWGRVKVWAGRRVAALRPSGAQRPAAMSRTDLTLCVTEIQSQQREQTRQLAQLVALLNQQAAQPLHADLLRPHVERMENALSAFAQCASQSSQQGEQLKAHLYGVSQSSSQVAQSVSRLNGTVELAARQTESQGQALARLTQLEEPLRAVTDQAAALEQSLGQIRILNQTSLATAAAIEKLLAAQEKHTATLKKLLLIALASLGGLAVLQTILLLAR